MSTSTSGWEHDALAAAFGTTWGALLTTIHQNGQWDEWSQLETELNDFYIDFTTPARPRITRRDGEKGLSGLMKPLTRIASSSLHDMQDAATILCFIRVNQIRSLAYATSQQVSPVDALTTAWMIFRDCTNLITANAWNSRFTWELRSRLNSDFRQFVDDSRVVSGVDEEMEYLLISSTYSPADDVSEDEELKATLEEAVNLSIITPQQSALLQELVSTAHKKETKASVVQAGSEIAVCAERHGIKPRAMRHRRSTAINALQQHAATLAA